MLIHDGNLTSGYVHTHPLYLNSLMILPIEMKLMQHGASFLGDRSGTYLELVQCTDKSSGPELALPLGILLGSQDWSRLFDEHGPLD